MNKAKICALASILFCTAAIKGIYAEDSSVKWSGFFDLQHNTYHGLSEKDGFRWGQFEVGLEQDISETVSIEGSLAYDHENEKFEIGSGLLKIEPFKNIEIAFGQFDVPLGIDHNYYPSIDRPFVSTPLLNEKMYDSWNDPGARLSVENNMYNAVFYVVNGQNLQANQEKAQSAGCRIGKVFKYSEIGFSLANDPAKRDSFSGLDFSYHCNNLNILAEIMNVNNSSDKKARAYYVQAKYDFGKYFLLARYGGYSEEAGYDRDSDSHSQLSRLSAGGGIKIENNVKMRIEYQLNYEDGSFSKKSNDALFFQTVVGF
ncbi:MAG: hypothetical protein GY730_09295 [bacterium]|nr:hypothetical protein [bacterium]